MDKFLHYYNRISKYFNGFLNQCYKREGGRVGEGGRWRFCGKNPKTRFYLD